MFLSCYVSYIYKYINKFCFVLGVYKEYFNLVQFLFLYFSALYSLPFCGRYFFVYLFFIGVLLFNASLFLLSPYLLSLLFVI